MSLGPPLESPRVAQGMAHLFLQPVMPWPELVALIHKLNSWERRITCVIHPEAVGVIDSAMFGGIRTQQGPAGYELSTGERIAL